MRQFFYVTSFIALIGLAFWAYRENYRTQAALKEVRQLHREIGAAHERLTMLRAEWAYLNRPDRLMDLAEMNFERLELLPLMPEAFGNVDEIAFPPPPRPVVTDPVQLSSDNADGEFSFP